MGQDVLMWVFSGVCGFVVLLLTGIWSEVRKLNDKFQEIAINQSKQNSRIDTLEKVLDRLPCLNNIQCPRE